MVVVSCDLNCISNLLRSCTWFKSTICVLMLTYVLPEEAIILLQVNCKGLTIHPYEQVITGYLLAGSAIGPGGLSVVSELVQVCSSICR